MLLPFIEEGNLAKQYDYTKNWNGVPNRPIIATVVGTFLCASTPDGDKVIGVNANGLQASVTDYYTIANIGNAFYTTHGLTKPGNAEGLPDKQARLSVARVSDGLSKTFLILEDAGRPNHYIEGGKLGPADHNDGKHSAVVGGIVNGAAWAMPGNVATYQSMSSDGLTANGPALLNASNNNEPFSFHTSGITRHSPTVRRGSLPTTSARLLLRRQLLAREGKQQHSLKLQCVARYFAHVAKNLPLVINL